MYAFLVTRFPESEYYYWNECEGQNSHYALRASQRMVPTLSSGFTPRCQRDGSSKYSIDYPPLFLSVLLAFLSAIVHNPQITQPSPISIDQIPRLIHEPRISLHHMRSIHPLHRRLQESLRLRSTPAGGPKLRNPQWSMSSQPIRLSNMVFEIARVCGITIPVDWHEIDVAIVALFEERFEPCQSHYTLAVRYGGCTQSYCPG